MSKKKKRLYSAEFAHRPAYLGDMGNRLKVSGIVVEGANQPLVMLAPTSISAVDDPYFTFVRPTLEEWKSILECTDDPVYFEQDETGIKAVHRKFERQISGVVQQKIWARDKFQCMYCGRKMGEVQLTVDHFVPLELGGENKPSNYISACRKCNKRKADQSPEAYLGEKYFGVKAYLDSLSSI